MTNNQFQRPPSSRSRIVGRYFSAEAVLTSTTRSSGRTMPRSASSGKRGERRRPLGRPGEPTVCSTRRGSPCRSPRRTPDRRGPPVCSDDSQDIDMARHSGPRSARWRGSCPGRRGSMSASPGLEMRARSACVRRALDADHPGPVGADQSQRLQLVERLGHPDDPGPAPGRINDHVRQLPSAARRGDRRPARPSPGPESSFLRCANPAPETWPR